MIKKIVLASNNLGKMAEIKSILAGLPIELIPQSDLNIPDIEETGMTFIENAIIKARNASKLSGLPTIADDSGLTVNALKGAPGVFSARYAGPHASDKDRIKKVLTELAKIKSANRQAAFHCVIALLQHDEDPVPIICHGIWDGEILAEPRGEKGFGYDPIFYVPSHRCSAAELDPIEKNKISHRARSLEQFIEIMGDSI